VVLVSWLPNTDTAALNATDFASQNTAGALSDVATALELVSNCTQGLTIISQGIDFGYYTAFGDLEIAFTGNNGNFVVAWGTQEFCNATTA